MGFFKKDKDAKKIKENQELISFNEKSINSLIVLLEGNDELIKELRQLQEKIKYLMPTANSKVIDFDKKIKNAIEDLKIVLIKSSGEELTTKANMILSNIKLLVADRKARE